MLDKHALEVAPPGPGFYNRIFVVQKANGKWRPVIDLSTLNRFVTLTPFRMETNVSVLNAIRRDDWMVLVDLKDAYFQVPIHPASRKFLRFQWGTKTYQFRVLAFGLSTAPQVFTRVMAPVSAILHQKGIRLLRYLDDWLVLATSESEAVKARDTVLDLCRTLGIVVNYEKSSLIPRQSAEYLGMRIDSPSLRAFPTAKRVDNLTSLVDMFLSSSSPPAITWLRLLGPLTSLCLLVPGGRRRMRSLQFTLHRSWSRERQPKDFPVEWNAEIVTDLHWWKDRQHLLQGKDLRPQFPEVLLHTDASDLGLGATTANLNSLGLWP